MKYMEMAVQLAYGQNSENKHFMLSVVAKRADGSLLVSSNIRTAHPIHHAHAEHRVLRKAGHGATLWVARVDRNLNICNSKPCQKCEAFCRNMRVKRVFYSVSGYKNQIHEYGCLEF